MKVKYFLAARKFIVLALFLLFTLPASRVIVSAEIKRPSNMILLEAGCFQMGSEEFVSEEPIHNVCVSDFYLDKFEVTQKNFERVMKFNPSSGKGKDFPVVNVSWVEAQQYCRKRAGRLPSEAEWEYANRAGTNSPYFWGDDMEGDFAWFKENSMASVHAVGERKPNSWGFHDMNGNVWEWVADWYRENFYEMSAKMEPDHNPQGPPAGQFLLIRGGSYKDDPFFLRSATRFWYEPNIKSGDLGFRCAADPEVK
jgi:formylglycine-generating enzyme required for sulfatase activity